MESPDPTECDRGLRAPRSPSLAILCPLPGLCLDLGHLAMSAQLPRHLVPSPVPICPVVKATRTVMPEYPPGGQGDLRLTLFPTLPWESRGQLLSHPTPISAGLEGAFPNSGVSLSGIPSFTPVRPGK